MTTVYMLTTDECETQSPLAWGEDVEYDISGKNEEADRLDCLYAYRTAELAVLMNYLYPRIAQPVLWEADADIARQRRARLICTRLRAIRTIPLPELTVERATELALRVVLPALPGWLHLQNWRVWARSWLAGDDRSLAGAAAGLLEASRRLTTPSADEVLVQWAARLASQAAQAASPEVTAALDQEDIEEGSAPWVALRQAAWIFAADAIHTAAAVEKRASKARADG